jgi:hypothetical protein
MGRVKRFFGNEGFMSWGRGTTTEEVDRLEESMRASIEQRGDSKYTKTFFGTLLPPDACVEPRQSI